MKLALVCMALGACVPSRTAVFGPVDRDVERRIGVRATWTSDSRVPAAIDDLLAKPLDRDAAVRIALASNRRLQAQYDQLGIAASEIAAATVLAPLRVDIEYKLRDTADELEIDVVQDVLDLLQVPQRRGIASAELAAARTRAVAATVDLVSRVEMAYFDVVAAMQEVELRQTAYDAASISADLAGRMRAAGNISELSLAREQSQRERARVDLARAQLDAETRRESLNELLGLDGKRTRWTVVRQLPAVPPTAPALDGLERDAVAANLELVAIRSDAEAAAGRVGVARVRAWLPELGVGVSADHATGAGWDFGPAVSFGLPLFNQQQGPRARAHAELARARNLASATGTEVRARARSIRQQVLEAHGEARHLFDVVLPLQQHVVDEALKQYNAMNASTFELLLARRDLVDAGRQYIDAARRYWRAEASARALARGGLPRQSNTGSETPTTSSPETHP
jgi:outer membrane protein TolC